MATKRLAPEDGEHDVLVVGAGCAGVVNSGMRLVRVSVTYRPLTGAGVSPTTKSVNVDWLVSQK